MKRRDEVFYDSDSGSHLDKNISRLVMLASGSNKPGRMFTEKLIENALGKLGRPEQTNMVMSISRWEKIAAMIAVVCGAGFGILVTVLTHVNSLLTGIVLIVMFVNWLIYYGGLIL